MIKRSVFTLVTSFLVVSPLGFALPTVAANVFNSSSSEISLELSNFSHIPEDVGIVQDIKATTIAEVGAVGIDILVDSLFVGNAGFLFVRNSDSLFVDKSIESEPLAYSNVQTSLSGIGFDYIGEANIVSKLIGRFDIPANTVFGFDLEASVLLRNETSDLLASPLSSSASLNLILRDKANQKDWDIFKFLGILNTNLIEIPTEISQDRFIFNYSPDFKIDQDKDPGLTFFGGTDEALLFSLKGSLEMIFDEPVQLELFATTRSCNYSSNVEDVCVKVPEPSNRLILSACVIYFIYKSLILRVMKKIVKLTL